MYYIKNGKLNNVIGQSIQVMVESASDLEELAEASVGTIAFTAGFANIWQLNANGEWIAIAGED